MSLISDLTVERPMWNMLYDRVAVQLLDDPADSPHGLVLPSTAARTSRLARVAAVGEGIISKSGHLRALDIQVGDQVVLSSSQTLMLGSEVEVDGQPYVLVREEQILGVITP